MRFRQVVLDRQQCHGGSLYRRSNRSYHRFSWRSRSRSVVCSTRRVELFGSVSVYEILTFWLWSKFQLSPFICIYTIDIAPSVHNCSLLKYVFLEIGKTTIKIVKYSINYILIKFILVFHVFKHSWLSPMNNWWSFWYYLHILV